ncbi:MAG: FapA family protein [candidate division Zixibacteria bacterium]|nr:FapA family protein [candidate division Zixibacteria bacterium]
MTTASSTAVSQRIKIIVAKDFMSATILLKKLKSEEPPYTFDEIVNELNAADVVSGLDHAEIARVIKEEVFGSPVRVAIGIQPLRGEHAQFTFHFQTSHSFSPKEESDGHIDYKDISFIQNTAEGNLLVSKTLPEPGTAGRTVHGKEILGPSGKDIPFSAGANTKVSDNGLQLLAATGGVILYQAGKVSVNDIFIIKGDIDHTVGNIDCRGSVKVAGDVKAGFSLKVDGNIEIGGNVEDATLIVGGSIFIKGGFFGKGEGHMQAGGDIAIKFAEGQRISAGNDLIVTSEIINCHVVAKGRVLVKGKKGKIVGGDIRADKEIRAPILGSAVGTSTLLTVGYDSDLMTRYHFINKEITRLTDDGERIKNALVNLYKLELNGKLPDDKRAILNELKSFRDSLPDTIAQLTAEKISVEEAIKKLTDARIVAEEILYSGVRATFGLVYRIIFKDIKKCMLSLEGYQVLISELKSNRPS